MPERMKAVVKIRPEAGAELVEREIPTLRPDEVLARVQATSICGTDVHIYQWNPWAQKRIGPDALPQVLGHEFAGEIVQVGSQVRNLKVGDYISAETHIPCGRCIQCLTGQMHLCHNLSILGVDRDGCFAEYAAVPESVCWQNDPAIPPEIASVQEPLGNAVYCTLVEPVVGRSVLIYGDGPTAIFAAAVARVSGASRVFLAGMEEARLAIARKMGADRTFNVLQDDTEELVLEETGGIGVDVVLEMAGAQAAIDGALRTVRKGGRVSAFGIPSDRVKIDWNDGLIFKGATIYGINGRLMWDTWVTVRSLLASGRLDLSPALTDRLPLEEFTRGFDRMLTSPKEAVKVILIP